MKKMFTKTLNTFLDFEVSQIIANVNERNLCARFAFYLQNEAHASGMSAYFADAEYNRKQEGRIKTILDESMIVSTINCDLILHSRGALVAEDNLIAMEMKKATATEENKNSDRRRLRALTKESYDGVWSADGIAHPEHVCGYKLGAFVVLDRKSHECRVEYYGGGALFLSETIGF